ncbi:MAG: hypothetical protein M5U09_01460 [Gammaproteobacteria bacterium]|nr:hypothetical protein [Gammaproteobacteria bacterium]
MSELEALLREIDRKNQGTEGQAEEGRGVDGRKCGGQVIDLFVVQSRYYRGMSLPDPFTKVFCFAGIAGTAYGTHALLTGDFSEPVTLPDTERVQSDLDRLRRAKQELEAKLDDEYLASMRNQQYDMFVALCHAVRENCL